MNNKHIILKHFYHLALCHTHTDSLLLPLSTSLIKQLIHLKMFALSAVIMCFSTSTVKTSFITDYKLKCLFSLCVLCHWCDTSSRRLNKWQTVSNGAHPVSAQDRLIDRFHTLVAHSSCWLHTSFGVLSGSITGDYSTRLTQADSGKNTDQFGL